MRLAEHAYRTITSIRGPLLFLDRVFCARIGEVVRIAHPGGEMVEGEVLKIEGHSVLLQLFGETRGLDVHVEVVFTDAVKKAPLSRGMIGRRPARCMAPCAIRKAALFPASRWC